MERLPNGIITAGTPPLKRFHTWRWEEFGDPDLTTPFVASTRCSSAPLRRVVTNAEENWMGHENLALLRVQIGT